MGSLRWLVYPFSPTWVYVVIAVASLFMAGGCVVAVLRRRQAALRIGWEIAVLVLAIAGVFVGVRRHTSPTALVPYQRSRAATPSPHLFRSPWLRLEASAFRERTQALVLTALVTATMGTRLCRAATNPQAGSSRESSLLAQLRAPVEPTLHLCRGDVPRRRFDERQARPRAIGPSSVPSASRPSRASASRTGSAAAVVIPPAAPISDSVLPPARSTHGRPQAIISCGMTSSSWLRGTARRSPPNTARRAPRAL